MATGACDKGHEEGSDRPAEQRQQRRGRGAAGQGRGQRLSPAPPLQGRLIGQATSRDIARIT